MSSFDGFHFHGYAPSAPPLELDPSALPLPPETSAGDNLTPSAPPPPPSGFSHPPPGYSHQLTPPATSDGHNPSPFVPPPPPVRFSHPLPEYAHQPPSPSLGYLHQPPSPSYSYSPSFHEAGAGVELGHFPAGTNPEIIRSFQVVDQDRSGSIDEKELQAALSTGYQKFSLRTVRLLMFLFSNSNSISKIGPTEFATLWICLGHWRAIFERFDRDRSGLIDSIELRDALLSIGYAVPPSVLQVLISKYNDGKKGGWTALNFDSFVECGLIVKGLTEKFKEKDPRFTGYATMTYEDFMKMIVPFLVA